MKIKEDIENHRKQINKSDFKMERKMRFVIQRVNSASVSVDDKVIASIGKGYLILFGAGEGDTKEMLVPFADKIAKMRIFADENEKTNLSINDVNGEILVVSQFTLYADCRKGRRPGFTDAAKPDTAIPLYDYYNQKIQDSGIHVETGVFGADMKVSLINDGPVTILLDSKDICKG